MDHETIKYSIRSSTSNSFFKMYLHRQTMIPKLICIKSTYIIRTHWFCQQHYKSCILTSLKLLLLLTTYSIEYEFFCATNKNSCRLLKRVWSNVKIKASVQIKYWRAIFSLYVVLHCNSISAPLKHHWISLLESPWKCLGHFRKE